MPVAFFDVGRSPYGFVNTRSGALGAGVKEDAFQRPTSNPFAVLYGPGQNQGGHYQPGLPYTGLNKRDRMNLSAVSPVMHDPTVNGIRGNGVYEHGVITLQDLLNVQAVTGAPVSG